MSCPTCFSLSCASVDDADLYSLESQLWPFNLNCPDDSDCSEAQSFNMVCCGQLLTGTFPAAATLDEKLAIIRDIVTRCAQRDQFCGDFGPPDPPCTGCTPAPPTQLYYNREQTCSKNCPDGLPFSYTVRSGTFAGLTQAQADSQAKAFACQQERLRKFCLTNLTTPGCVGKSYNQSITAVGSVITPCTWTVVAGALPDGLLLGGVSPNIDTTLGATETIEGTPTTHGTFNFTLRCEGADGSFMQKDYSICISSINPASFPDGTVGESYDEIMTLSDCSTSAVTWAVTAGSLPPGLTLDTALGEISGTPTTPGTFNFTITATIP